MESKNFFLTWGMLLIGVLMNVFGVYIVKAKINILGEIQLNSIGVVWNYFLTVVQSPLAVFGIILILAAPLPYVVALSRMQLSIAYPVSIGLNYLIILPLSFICLGEAVTINKMIAFGLILVSLYLLYK